MKIYFNPPRSEWGGLCRRAGDDSANIKPVVEGIINRVRNYGDEALVALAKEIDGVDLASLRVSDAELTEAAELTSPDLKMAIAHAIRNIEAFHHAQLRSDIIVETEPGVTCIQRQVPIRNVGLYIPGGTAPLFSTVLMLGIPARLAGCPRVAMCTPCRKDGKVSPVVLYAATQCGISEIYKVGGAQAIAAMAFGTDTILPVNKIFGPGNRYVTAAKQIVSIEGTAIDMPAGPSEVMVLADESSNPEFVAADLLSQCEHGKDSQAIVLCSSEVLSQKIADATRRQSYLLKRCDFIAQSLSNSRIIVFPDINDMVDFANQYAPEHLIISLAEPAAILSHIDAAGSVFIGNYSPESAGDYASGTNHTLPTAGWASVMSGVGPDSFMRRMTLQEISPEGIRNLAPAIIAMAEAEGLDAHANAVRVRII